MHKLKVQSSMNVTLTLHAHLLIELVLRGCRHRWCFEGGGEVPGLWECGAGRLGRCQGCMVQGAESYSCGSAVQGDCNRMRGI